LAVVLLYFKELLHNRELTKKVFLAFLPTATIGFLLYKIVKNVFFESQWLMLGVFVAVGIIFILVEKFYHPLNSSNIPLKSLNFRHALLIGLIQSLAVIPGVSRSGSVIVGMLFLGYDRSEAAKFSFMLSIPTILAASAYDLYKMRSVAFANLNNINLLAVGFVVSFIFALISVKWLIKFLQTHTLLPFGLYRLALAALILVSLNFL
jgi:undecaprenyl-diphosphatase